MQLIENGTKEDAIKFASDQILIGASPISIKKSDNGLYLGETHFTPGLSDPKQAEADNAISQITNELKSGKVSIRFVRSSATQFTITAT